jgi:hypothetical protein
MIKHEDMNIHDIVVYIRDLQHTEEECEWLLVDLQEHTGEWCKDTCRKYYSPGTQAGGT